MSLLRVPQQVEVTSHICLLPDYRNNVDDIEVLDENGQEALAEPLQKMVLGQLIAFLAAA
jgi:hypothetical protein